MGLDDCTREREWKPAELDILKIVADMIGGAIIRERYVEDLKNANTIVEFEPDNSFRLRGDPSLSLIYVSHNVTLYGYDPTAMIEANSVLAKPASPRRRPQSCGTVGAGGDGGTEGGRH